MFTRMTWLFHNVIVLQIIKTSLPIIWRDHPWTRFVLLDSSAGPVPSSPKPNPIFAIIRRCDGTGPADESKRTKRVQGWSRQIMGREVFIICNTITLWNNHIICVNMHIKRVDCLYNSIHRYMIRLWWSRAMFMEVRVLNRSRLL